MIQKFKSNSFRRLTFFGKNDKLCLNNTSYVVKMIIDTTMFDVKSSIKVLFFCVLCGFSIIASAACERAAQAKAATEKYVSQRAQARWDALVKGDLKSAYTYLTPATRSIQSYDEYASKIHRKIWTAAKVEKVECDESALCKAQIAITYDASRFKDMSANIPETWIKVDDEWWLGQRN